MSKLSVARKPAEQKPHARPLTLADITLTWNDGDKDHEATPEQIALALAYTWKMLNDGHGSFGRFKDACSAHEKLRAAEDLIIGFAHTAENGSEVESEAYWAVRELVRDGRVRYELSNHPPQPETYRVQIATPVAGGAR